MAFTQQDVQVALRGSRMLSQMRVDIAEFLNNLGFSERQDGDNSWGWGKALGSEIRLNDRKRVVIWQTKERDSHRYWLRIVRDGEEKNGLWTPLYWNAKGERLDCNLIEPLWLALPRLLDELVKIDPSFEGSFRSYKEIAERYPVPPKRKKKG